MDNPHQILQSFTDALNTIVVTTEDDVTQQSRLGTQTGFIELGSYWKDMKRLAAQLKNCDVREVPIILLGEVKDNLVKILSVVQQFQAYQPANNNRKLELTNLFMDAFRAIFASASPILAIGATASVDERQIQLYEFEKEKKRIFQGFEEELKNAQASAKRAAEAADSAKAAAAKTGVSAEAKHFQELSESHKKYARAWLIVSIAVAGTIIGMSWYHFYNPYMVTPDLKWIILQHIISKLIIISILSFILVFSVRNYNTSRHNHVINEHRAKALATFQTFVSGTSADDTKDAVLIQSCKAVFGHHASGYLRKENESSGLPIVDFIKPFVSR